MSARAEAEGRPMNPETRWSDADQRDLADRDVRREIADDEGINIDDVSDAAVEDFQDPDDWTDR